MGNQPRHTDNEKMKMNIHIHWRPQEVLGAAKKKGLLIIDRSDIGHESQGPRVTSRRMVCLVCREKITGAEIRIRCHVTGAPVYDLVPKKNKDEDSNNGRKSFCLRRYKARAQQFSLRPLSSKPIEMSTF